MPPPRPDEVFPETMLLVSVNVPSFSRKPYPVWPVLLLIKLRSDMATLMLESTRTIWPLLPPLIARDCAPGPLRVRLLVNDRSPLVNMIVPLTLAANVIVLPGFASAMTWRSDPCPSSLGVVTTFARMRDRTSTPAGIDNSRTSRTIAVTTTRDRMRLAVLAWRNATSCRLGTLRLAHVLASLSWEPRYNRSLGLPRCSHSVISSLMV